MTTIFLSNNFLGSATDFEKTNKPLTPDLLVSFTKIKEMEVYLPIFFCLQIAENQLFVCSTEMMIQVFNSTQTFQSFISDSQLKRALLLNSLLIMGQMLYLGNCGCPDPIGKACSPIVNSTNNNESVQYTIILRGYHTRQPANALSYSNYSLSTLPSAFFVSK